MGKGKNGRHFIGKCSKCGDKKVTVVKFRGGQICVNKCLPAAINRLGAGPAALTANEPFSPQGPVGGFADPTGLGDNPIELPTATPKKLTGQE